MPVFAYKALTEGGEVVEGSLTAEKEDEVLAFLEAQGLLPISIKRLEGKRSFLSFASRLKRRRVSKRDVLTFTQSLSLLVRSGIPVDRALSICMEAMADSPIVRVLEDVRNDIRQGLSLSEALSKYPGIFSKLYVNTVRAGEAGGFLAEVLERLHSHMERMEEFKSSLLNSLIYPAFLVGVGVISVAVLVVFVVPRFYLIFSSTGITPPFPIPQLAAVGSFVESYGAFVLSFMLLAGVGFFLWFRKGGRERFYAYLMDLPFAGRLALEVENIKFAKNMGTLIINGVPILQAIVIVREMFSNPVFRDELDGMYKAIREGKKLSFVLGRRKDLWHPMLVGMSEVGEEVGELGEMLVRAADVMERGVETKLRRLIAMVEPAAVLSMGLIVGSIVVSMINAIFSINEMVR